MPHRIEPRRSLAPTPYISQPTKEQVRAYMAAREAARRPPPPPEEIRRQLGWRIAHPDDERLRIQFYLIPTSYSRLAAQILVDWMLAPARRAARHAPRH
jgi:hypothetical protein